ncbi:preprotein translocase subunit SecE [Candidatus Giovannonibacteria bacterium RIFCSPHIGHO2_01_FULL_45_33]|uniref:Protein translocase subunit SecE n=1 Tax=Candidatus Giovannonibacteria bacterium RIFCSPLOWO2_01_FULL_45_34 TaxID=1798351 RepID=A0A1F5WYV1_9BACT|nr:MAG: preprotein translocase subunit SecE [Candidatus Giovannonibacteria bacterium RIFCSPHIGHO2_01_FULL_45_33]OGF71003.1 MAG: preprotein translocase subunit SecE [Candidatus Giovannonibacteria bacterium RIFCSPHIGHO2_02_FULL_44_11]OGF80799.1 MAG: preprotein translocase subunit SecE [Candidatus Giovannonibacteria bacterium RIFCSPLOWO2_01_FULL_45_34]
MYQKLVNYLKETRVEMRKVNWPTKNETVRFTIVVIAVSLGVSFILGAFDYVFTSILKLFI